MTLLRHSAVGFAALTSEGSIELRLTEQMLHHTGRRPSPAEVVSWKRSLPFLAQDLIDAGLGNIEVLVEHHLPLTSKRADVVLAGRHPRTGEPSYVVVELKQWSRAHAYDGDPELVLVDGMPHGPKLHPVAQVRGYCDYITDFTKALHDFDDAVAGAAYLHNATVETDVAALYDYPQDRQEGCSRELAVATSSSSCASDSIRLLRARPTRTCCFRPASHPPSSCSPWRPRKYSSVNSSYFLLSNDLPSRSSCTRWNARAARTARRSSS